MLKYHKEVGLGGQHIAHNGEYPNAATRIAATNVTAADLKKLYLQLDNYSFWVLTAVAPVAWVAVGSPINVLKASASLNFPNIAKQDSATLTIELDGATVGDSVILAPPSALPAGLMPVGFVSGNDTVSITLFNLTAGNINPAAQTWGVSIIK